MLRNASTRHKSPQTPRSMIVSRKRKVEFLLIATELLKLADEIDKQLAGDLKLVR